MARRAREILAPSSRTEEELHAAKRTCKHPPRGLFWTISSKLCKRSSDESSVIAPKIGNSPRGRSPASSKNTVFPETWVLCRNSPTIATVGYKRKRGNAHQRMTDAVRPLLPCRSPFPAMPPGCHDARHGSSANRLAFRGWARCHAELRKSASISCRTCWHATSMRFIAASTATTLSGWGGTITDLGNTG